MRTSRTQIRVGLATTVLSLAAIALPGVLRAVDPEDTLLLSQPDLSATHITFAYDEDLWLAMRDGSGARRLTSHEGYERDPHFSPDGALVAFSAEYDGNVDVYVVPATGGAPRRLTWHPGVDVVEGFTPDGSAVLFNSPREVFTRRYVQLFTVPVDGGHPERLPIPNGLRGSFSGDGSRIAYIPISERNAQWKHYRGGTTSRIWIYDVDTHAVEEIPQPAGRSNDTDPLWIGDHVYFRSDRDGEINLYRYTPGSGEVEPVTSFDDFPVLAVNSESGRAGASIVFERAGRLHLLDTRSHDTTPLRVAVASDLTETRPRLVDGADQLRSAQPSPTGVRAVLEVRGDIVTVPVEKGDPRNLTATPGVHERSPVWSPDGSRIAYLSDESGEYRLHIAAGDGRGEIEAIDLEGAGFYEDPRWSPDSTKIAYVDNSWTLYVLDLTSRRIERVASEPHYGPLRTLSPVWSPDSAWIAYTLNSPSYIQQIHLYSVDEKYSVPVTDGLSEVTDPAFDGDGGYLFFRASTDAGPVKQWFAMSNADMSITSAIYVAVLAKGVPSPLKRESDEESTAGDGDAEDTDAEGTEEEGAGSGDEALEVTVDFDGLDQRILALPIEPGPFDNLATGAPGTVYFVARGDGDAPDRLRGYELATREEKTLLEGRNIEFRISHDRQKILYRVDDTVGIADLGDKIDTAVGRVDLAAVSVRVEPLAEWRQIFHEAWRVNRDYFYDPGMHGADWEAMREKYEAFLPHLATRRDLNRLLQWMSSELAVGHHRVFGGERRVDVDRVPGGLLGADYEIDQGRYRISKVYGGLNWNPDLRSPLTEPGVDVSAGEYLLAVGGAPLSAGENLFARFEATAGKSIDLEVGPTPDGGESRTVTVVPVANETALRNRDWVEGNLRKVQEATGGRVAYVYLPNTTALGHTYFKRYFFPQVDRDAVIIDERFNGGGQVADYYIDHLRRPYISHWATRYGADIRTPGGAILGPKVMIIDETAGSGGDLLPWMFRKLEIGTLVGKRTWGGLVGTLGFPTLMDGGGITAPNLAIWTEDGFVVENVGVPPDIEVEQWPADVIAGRDPQLEKAIEIALDQLEADPPPTPRRPEFPTRAIP